MRVQPAGGARRGERGSVMIMFVLFLPVALGMAALVVDIGFAWSLKRHLQASADAAALAGASELPDTGASTAKAMNYSASAGGFNRRDSLPEVTTGVQFLASNSKIKVTQTADSPIWFARIFRDDPVRVSASAVASRTSEPIGSPLAVYVHEVCGDTWGNKGFISGGLNMRIEGGIHSNGHFEVKNGKFDAKGPATIYRTPHPGPGHKASCKTADLSDSRYCTACGTDRVTDQPKEAGWRDWVTPYHTRTDVTNAVPCTQTFTSDHKFTSSSPDGVYCLPDDKKFTLDPGACSSRLCKITVVAGMIEVGGTGSIQPFDAAKAPVLFYGTKLNGEVILNPSSAYNWEGYIINRVGGIKINASGVTSPLHGLLEAQWVEINGENFTMLGTFDDQTEGGLGGAVSLVE